MKIQFDHFLKEYGSKVLTHNVYFKQSNSETCDVPHETSLEVNEFIYFFIKVEMKLKVLISVN